MLLIEEYAYIAKRQAKQEQHHSTTTLNETSVGRTTYAVNRLAEVRLMLKRSRPKVSLKSCRLVLHNQWLRPSGRITSLVHLVLLRLRLRIGFFSRFTMSFVVRQRYLTLSVRQFIPLTACCANVKQTSRRQHASPHMHPVQLLQQHCVCAAKTTG